MGKENQCVVGERPASSYQPLNFTPNLVAVQSVSADPIPECIDNFSIANSSQILKPQVKNTSLLTRSSPQNTPGNNAGAVVALAGLGISFLGAPEIGLPIMLLSCGFQPSQPIGGDDPSNLFDCSNEVKTVCVDGRSMLYCLENGEKHIAECPEKTHCEDGVCRTDVGETDQKCTTVAGKRTSACRVTDMFDVGENRDHGFRDSFELEVECWYPDGTTKKVMVPIGGNVFYRCGQDLGFYFVRPDVGNLRSDPGDEAACGRDSQGRITKIYSEYTPYFKHTMRVESFADYYLFQSKRNIDNSEIRYWPNLDLFVNEGGLPVDYATPPSSPTRVEECRFINEALIQGTSSSHIEIEMKMPTIKYRILFLTKTRIWSCRCE